MDQEHRAAMSQAVLETFEEVGFIALTPTESSEGSAPVSLPPGYLWGRIELRAPHTGAITVACPAPLLEEINGAVYGPDSPALAPTVALDTLGEVANTIAGRYLGSIIPANETFALGLPETGCDATACSGNSLAYFTDDGRSVLVFLVESSEE